MREIRPYGSVRGARSNARPYRDSRMAIALRAKRFEPLLRGLDILPASSVLKTLRASRLHGRRDITTRCEPVLIVRRGNSSNCPDTQIRGLAAATATQSPHRRMNQTFTTCVRNA
jgi:hypothetical protein